MSANLTPKDSIDRMTSMALSGDLNTAIAVLNQSGLNEDQKAKIAAILKEPRSDMEQRIVEVFGEGNIASAAPSSSATQSLQTCHPIANELYTDLTGNIFYHLFRGDLINLTAVACLNKHWNSCTRNFWAGCDLNRLCPELTILDAETQGVMCEDEPKISKLQLFKWVREISPHVEGNAGLTQLTMTKGTTLNQLIEIAKADGMTINPGWRRIVEKLGNVPVKQTYSILITNNVFMNTQNEDEKSHEVLVEGLGCTMPRVQEYVALCVFTNKIFKKCVYEKILVRSSTHIGGMPLNVGNCSHDRLTISRGGFVLPIIGAGGQRKLTNVTS